MLFISGIKVIHLYFSIITASLPQTRSHHQTIYAQWQKGQFSFSNINTYCDLPVEILKLQRSFSVAYLSIRYWSLLKAQFLCITISQNSWKQHTKERTKIHFYKILYSASRGPSLRVVLQKYPSLLVESQAHTILYWGIKSPPHKHRGIFCRYLPSLPKRSFLLSKLWMYSACGYSFRVCTAPLTIEYLIQKLPLVIDSELKLLEHGLTKHEGSIISLFKLA